MVFNIANMDNCPEKIMVFDTVYCVKPTPPRASIGSFQHLQIFTSVNLFAFQIGGGIK